MSANSLQVVEAELQARGMRDVKFLFKRDAMAVPMSDLEEDVAQLLGMFLAGEYDVVESLPSEDLTSA